jgi:hypothetical protein
LGIDYPLSPPLGSLHLDPEVVSRLESEGGDPETGRGAREAEITRTYPSGIRELYKKYSAETSAAIKSSCEMT